MGFVVCSLLKVLGAWETLAHYIIRRLTHYIWYLDDCVLYIYFEGSFVHLVAQLSGIISTHVAFFGITVNGLLEILCFWSHDLLVFCSHQVWYSHLLPLYFLVTDDYRRKIFFNYEKRIRMRSPPEKVSVFIVSLYPIKSFCF